MITENYNSHQKQWKLVTEITISTEISGSEERTYLILGRVHWVSAYDKVYSIATHNRFNTDRRSVAMW